MINKNDVSKTRYLFSYFINNGEDGLHLAYSTNGLKWNALKNGDSYLQPTVGESKLMRDPCLFLGPMAFSAWSGPLRSTEGPSGMLGRRI